MPSPPDDRLLTIRCLAPQDVATAALWDAFVVRCPGATFFHRAGWQEIVRDVFHHDTYFLYAELDGLFQGVLPLGHINSWMFGNALTSLPFAVYGGVAALTTRAAEALELEAQNIAKRLGVAYLELRNVSLRHVDWPTQDLYVTFRKEILAEEDANMQAIPRKQRAMVRKGIKNGLTSEIDETVDRFFTLFADNVHRHGTPVMPKKYFKTLMAVFDSDCEVLTVVASDGRPLSSVISFYFRDEVLPYYAGDFEPARDLAANDFKYWELMRRACARGLKVFDYGRSKQGTGAYAFKKNWGFDPKPLHYQYCLYKRDAIPQNNPSNAKYQLMISAWRRMPLPLANWLGPFVVRNLG
jgi:FemAB-related protein (PEP-CTERM system-associated)